MLHLILFRRLLTAGRYLLAYCYIFLLINETLISEILYIISENKYFIIKAFKAL